MQSVEQFFYALHEICDKLFRITRHPSPSFLPSFCVICSELKRICIRMKSTGPFHRSSDHIRMAKRRGASSETLEQMRAKKKAKKEERGRHVLTLAAFLEFMWRGALKHVNAHPWTSILETLCRTPSDELEDTLRLAHEYTIRTFQAFLRPEHPFVLASWSRFFKCWDEKRLVLEPTTGLSEQFRLSLLYEYAFASWHHSNDQGLKLALARRLQQRSYEMQPATGPIRYNTATKATHLATTMLGAYYIQKQNREGQPELKRAIDLLQEGDADCKARAFTLCTALLGFKREPLSILATVFNTMHRFVFLTTIFAFATCCSSSTQKFRHWFPKYERHWLNASEICTTQLNDYWTANRTRHHATCAVATDCILKNTTETIKSNMASAAIFLGLTPSILALIGPSVMDLSLLSARLPILAILLALASPAVNSLYCFRGAESSEEISRASTSAIARDWHHWTKNRSPLAKTAIRLAEYMIVGGLLVNTIQVSIDLDLRSVSGWRCGQMHMPLMWCLLSLAVHAMGILAVHLRHRKPPTSITFQAPALPEKRGFLRSVRWKTRIMLLGSRRWESLARGQDSRVGEVLLWLASLTGIGHMVFGMLVFSSLIFVGALDGLPVLARYAVSAAICQAIMLLELAGMRLDLASVEVTPTTESKATLNTK
ncbi:hypothetical protein K458DRAFT_427891 [Lentithecium fluviatile CBS 122367]|uniref:Uncharacterized protein n=1 Tax=Lentithecium fluviatile CBS 122367 TaxID=1168545 RepID=A0A6G1JGX2_9PLEO|nr:hypothetical protein K458DRAFT_427891 [Lentithecium fluviatile CBS 122367]